MRLLPRSPLPQPPPGCGSLQKLLDRQGVPYFDMTQQGAGGYFVVVPPSTETQNARCPWPWAPNLPRTVEVYPSKAAYTSKAEPLLRLQSRMLWVGDGHNDRQQYGDVAKGCQVSSLLVCVVDREYVLISFNVIAFTTDDTIVGFSGVLGDSGIPYATAFGTRNVYMLDTQYVLPLAVLDGASDPLQVMESGSERQRLETAELLPQR